MAKELNRNRLKTHFKAGAIPREEHFAELFDNSLNQLDDGIRKSDHTGLEIEAAPGSGEAILFFRDFEFQGGPAEPDWKMIVQQNDEATGLNVTNTDDESRLFIDLATGNVAIGTVKTPENDKLHVAGNLSIQRDQHLLFRGDGQLRSGVWNETGQAYQDMEKHQILFRSSEKILELREEGRIVFSPGSTDGLPTAKLTIDAAGNLFIGSVPTGSPNPALKLYVGGNTKVAGGLETTGALTVGTDLTVRGTTTNEIIKVHQVIGKVAQQDAVGPLYLNQSSGQNVEIASAGTTAHLLLHGKMGIGIATTPTDAIQIGNKEQTASDQFLSIQAKESSDPNNKYSTGVKLAIGNDEWTIRHDDHADRRGFNVGYKTPDQAEELTRLRIDEQGKVLIGATGTATAASVKLEVIGDVKANTVQATTFSGTNASLTEKLTTKLIDGTENGKISIGAAGAPAGLKLEVNGDAIVSGNVGIGRQNPQAKLHVEGRIEDLTGAVMPVGAVISFFGVTAPKGWYLCDGSWLNFEDDNWKTLHQKLYEVLGSRPLHRKETEQGMKMAFQLPDLRGRFVVGVNPMNSGAKIEQNNEILSEYILNTEGGEQQVQLTTASLPAHNHAGTTNTSFDLSFDVQSFNSERRSFLTSANGVIDISKTFITIKMPPGFDDVKVVDGISWTEGSVGRGTGSINGVKDVSNNTIELSSGSEAQNVAIGNTGQGGSHNNLPPFRALSYIIKF